MADPTRSKLTYDDYVLLPDDGMQHQLIDGELHVNAAPNTRHQLIVTRLAYQLHGQVAVRGLGEVLVAPYDVVFSPYDVVQPDLLVVLRDNAAIIDDRHATGAPDLVVEVLSPSTAGRDWGPKLALYRASGVREVWIVDPADERLHQHVLEAGAYRVAGAHHRRVQAAVLEGVGIDLEQVW